MEEEPDCVFCSLRMEPDRLGELVLVESIDELLNERRARVRTRGVLDS
jgi:hypothetical protein